jgi:hypothetical protein
VNELVRVPVSRNHQAVGLIDRLYRFRHAEPKTGTESLI